MYTDVEMSRTVLAGYAAMGTLTLEELMAGYESRQVAYLDLRKMRVTAASQLINIGPNSCLAGELSLLPKKRKAPSRVRIICIALLSHAPSPASFVRGPATFCIGLNKSRVRLTALTRSPVRPEHHRGSKVRGHPDMTTGRSLGESRSRILRKTTAVGAGHVHGEG